MAEQSTGLDSFMEQAGLEPEQAPEEPTEQLLDEEPAPEVETEVEQTPAVNPEVEKATRDGWVPKDQWKGDPEEWVSARKFNERGQMMGQIRELRQAQDQFADRLEKQRLFMEAQTKQQLADLEAQRQNAVELADVDKFNKVQKQIDDLSQPETNQASAAQQEKAINDWNANNPWIFEDSPKAVYGKAMFAQYMGQGMSATDAIKQMEVAVAKHYPPQNPRREQPATTEAPRPTKGKRREASLQWNQLTREEVQMWHLLKDSAFKGDKEAFLQSVKDSRG